MPLLIDGYNLLNATGIVGRGGPSSLGRSRLALLNFLAASIDPQELPHTTVVFDAHDPPPGLPRVVQHGPLLVRFAARNQTADQLIEELIRADSAPRRLVVVSSDHEIQRAARRRRATAVGSDLWYADLILRDASATRSRPTFRCRRPFRCSKRTSTTGSASSAANRSWRRSHGDFGPKRYRKRPMKTPSRKVRKSLRWTIPSRPATAKTFCAIRKSIQ